MKKKHNKGLEIGMKVWGEGGSYVRKDWVKLFYSHEYQSTLHLNQEASGSRYKALWVYETFLYVTSLHLTPTLRVSVILPFYRWGNWGSVRLSGSQLQDSKSSDAATLQLPPWRWKDLHKRLTSLPVKKFHPFLEKVSEFLFSLQIFTLDCCSSPNDGGRELAFFFPLSSWSLPGVLCSRKSQLFRIQWVLVSRVDHSLHLEPAGDWQPHNTSSLRATSCQVPGRRVGAGGICRAVMGEMPLKEG